MHIINAFSKNMIPGGCRVTFVPLTLEDAQGYAEGSTSAVGHADTAAVFSGSLGRDVPANRVSVMLSCGDKALLGQYVGTRLPEGATTLPEGATIEWFVITVVGQEEVTRLLALDLERVTRIAALEDLVRELCSKATLSGVGLGLVRERFPELDQSHKGSFGRTDEKAFNS